MPYARGMIVESFPVGFLQCNCTIVGCPRTRQALVVDPGGDVPLIEETLARHGLRVAAIVHTHAHFDHVAGTGELARKTGAPVLLHPGDRFLWDDLAGQLGWVGLRGAFPIPPAPPPDQELSAGQTVRFGEQGTLVLHTPGHTPGSVCFSLGTPEGLLLLSGDTLFAGSIGRTDFPGGDHEQLLTSIHERLLPLEDSTRVIPGHGPATTIGAERRQNPFLR